MALINSLQAGVSGLKGFQTKMDVIGNNIANVNTSGFKSGRVAFSEMLQKNMSRGGADYESAPKQNNQVGLGVRVASIDQDMSQGSLDATNRTTDLALEGNGFFMVNDGSQNMLTRSGNFSFNKNGNLVTQQGLSVQGFNANSAGEVVSGGSANDIQVDFQDVYSPQKTQNVNLAGNLNSKTSEEQIVSAVQALTTNSGDLATRSTDLNALDQTTGDLSSGGGQTIQVTLTEDDPSSTDPADAVTNTYGFQYGTDGTTVGEFVDFITSQSQSNGSTANATATLDDGLINLRSDRPGASSLDISLDDAGGNFDPPTFDVSQEGAYNSRTISSTVYDDLGEAHTLIVEFTQGLDQSGDRTSSDTWQYQAKFLDGETITANPTGEINFDSSGNITDDSSTITFNPNNGSNPMSFALNFDSGSKSLSQFQGTTTANVDSQDGFAKGELVDFFIDKDGLIVGNYSNGKSKNLAQLAVADVANPEGLSNEGNGLYAAQTQAGEVRTDTASSMVDTSVNSGFLEGSNVDLAQEFTEMIVTQRAYQSNARVITTSDQLMAEAVQLKR
ncbi:MAG: flagellar hook protein FlgE [Bacteroidota bacterium]